MVGVLLFVGYLLAVLLWFLLHVMVCVCWLDVFCCMFGVVLTAGFIVLLWVFA